MTFENNFQIQDVVFTIAYVVCCIVVNVDQPFNYNNVMNTI